MSFKANIWTMVRATMTLKYIEQPIGYQPQFLDWAFKPQQGKLPMYKSHKSNSDLWMPLSLVHRRNDQVFVQQEGINLGSLLWKKGYSQIQRQNQRAILWFCSEGIPQHQEHFCQQLAVGSSSDASFNLQTCKLANPTAALLKYSLRAGAAAH